MNASRWLSAIALGAAVALAQAHEFKLGAITIGHPYARATAAGQATGGAFLTLANGGGAADRLLSVGADVAQSAELHSMSMEGNVMRMRAMPAIELPAGQTVALQPGGWHIMLIGLKAPLKAGEHFPLKLRFEQAGELTVTVNVESAEAAMEMKH